MKGNDIKQYTGENSKTYIAYSGKVYDVSASKLWKKGIHMRLHKGGNDLTASLEVAPHGDEVLKKFAVVGNFEEEETVQTTKERLRLLYRMFHPHPVFVHFPIALFVFSAFLDIVWLITDSHSFALAAGYSYIGAAAGNIPAIFAGLLSWWVNYDLAKTTTFKRKIVGSSLLFIFSITTILLYIYNAPIYLISIAVWLSAGLVVYTAYQGGKITFPV